MEKLKYLGKHERVFGHSATVKIDKGTICKLYRNKAKVKEHGPYTALVYYNGEFVLTIVCNKSWKKETK